MIGNLQHKLKDIGYIICRERSRSRELLTFSREVVLLTFFPLQIICFELSSSDVLSTVISNCGRFQYSNHPIIFAIMILIWLQLLVKRSWSCFKTRHEAQLEDFPRLTPYHQELMIIMRASKTKRLKFLIMSSSSYTYFKQN